MTNGLLCSAYLFTLGVLLGFGGVVSFKKLLWQYEQNVIPVSQDGEYN